MFTDNPATTNHCVQTMLRRSNRNATHGAAVIVQTAAGKLGLRWGGHRCRPDRRRPCGHHHVMAGGLVCDSLGIGGMANFCPAPLRAVHTAGAARCAKSALRGGCDRGRVITHCAAPPER